MRHGLAGDLAAPAPGPAASCHDLRAAVVPDVAEAPGQAGGAALRSAAVQPGVGLLVALSASWTRHQPCLPNVHLQNPDQDGRGAEQQTDVGSEDPGHRLHPHPAQLPRRGARLLFLLGCRQLDTVLQPLPARLPASDTHHDARAATTHASAHQSIAASVPEPGGVPAGSGQRSGHEGAALRLCYLHLGASGWDLRGPSPISGHHDHLQSQEPKTCLQMSQARRPTRRQAEPFREICLTWRWASSRLQPENSPYKESNGLLLVFILIIIFVGGGGRKDYFFFMPLP